MKDFIFFNIEQIYPTQSKLLGGLDKKYKGLVMLAKPYMPLILINYFILFKTSIPMGFVPEQLSWWGTSIFFAFLFLVTFLNLFWIYGIFFEGEAFALQKKLAFFDWIQNQPLLTESERLLFLSNTDLLLLLPPLGVLLRTGKWCVKCALGIGFVAGGCMSFDQWFGHYSKTNRYPSREIFIEFVDIDKWLDGFLDFLGINSDGLTPKERKEIQEAIINKAKVASEIEAGNGGKNISEVFSELKNELAETKKKLKDLEDQQNQSWLSWSSWSSWGGKKK